MIAKNPTSLNVINVFKIENLGGLLLKCYVVIIQTITFDALNTLAEMKIEGTKSNTNVVYLVIDMKKIFSVSFL